MNWTRVSLFCLGAALLASSQPAFAQVVNEQTGVVQLEDYSGSMSLSNDGGTWMQVDRMSGDGVGFQSGYTRVGIRNKWIDFGPSHVFTELNGTMNDQGRLGTNLGLGYRTMYDGGVLGVHGWYDNYESNYGHNYQQAVVGAEYMHEYLDLRANGYMPFGNRDNFIGILNPGTELTFQGNDFGTLGQGQVERSLAGFDAEAGVPVPVATFLRAYAGTYFLTANDDDTWGARGRLEARVGQGASVNFMVSDDERFGTNLNLGATIWYGGGPTSPLKFQRDRSGWSRMNDPVRRAQPVQLAQDRDEVLFVPLVNTDTGNQFNITWVDNTAVAPGDGTFENPFTQLPNSAPGSDYILVRRGVGNTVGNIVLENDQHLFGEGRVYTLNTDRLGTVEIPDQFFDQAGPRPTLVPNQVNVPIVTLANNNEVINFNMQGGTSSGIFGAFVEDFRIEHVQIDNSIGITITDASGTGILNNIDVPSIAAGQTGIFIRNQGGDQLNLTMTDITTEGGDFGVQLDALGGDIIANVNGLRIEGTGDTGLVLSQDSALLNVNLQNATIDSNNDGMLIFSNDGESNIDLTNVTVTGAGDLINIIGQNQTVLTVDGDNVNASDSAAGSGIAIDVNNSDGLFRFENSILSNNAEDGFRLNADNGSVVFASIIDSQVNGNGDNNFDVTASGGSTVVFFVDPTSATDSGAEAFQFLAQDVGTSLISTLIDVDLSRAGESAISGVVTGGAFSQLNLTNVQASDSGLHGLTVNVANGLVGDASDFEAFITNSTFTRSGLGNSGRGVNLFAGNSANIYLEMDGTPANNNGGEGLHYEALTGVNGAGTIEGIVTNGNFSDNPNFNVFGLVEGAGSTATWTFTNVTADNQSIAGPPFGAVVLESNTGGVQDIVWTGANSSISQNANDGVNLTADGAGSTVNFTFSDGRINSNGQQGIDALASNTGSITVNLNDAEVTLNADENVLAVALTGGSAFVNADNTNLSSAGLDNVLLTADGAGSIVGGIFDSVTLDDSGLNGLRAEIENLGSLDLQFLSSDPLNPSSASNNANGSGIRIRGDNADSITVVSSGESEITDNLNDNVDIDILTADLASIQIAGLMDRSLTGDGINVNFDNVASGGINIGSGSAIDNADDGVDIFVSDSTLDQGISVSGMIVNGNGDEPIIITTTNSTITGGSISGNETQGGNNGISWFTDSGTVDVNIRDNIVSEATDNGILVALSGNTTGAEVHIDNNVVTGTSLAPQNGIQLSLSNTASVVNGTISDNDVTDVANIGILVDVGDTAGVQTLSVDTNTISGSGSDGFLYNGQAGTTLGSLVVADNAADQNVGNGLNVQLTGLDTTLGQPSVEFRGNASTNNGGNGILLTSLDTSLTDVSVIANETLTNGGDGIGVSITSPSGVDTLVSLTVQNNLATDNGGAGIDILLSGLDTGAIVPDVILEANVANTNVDEGISLSISDMDAGNVTVDGSTTLGNGADGILISLARGNFDLVTVTGNSSSGNSGAGINLFTDDANIAAADISGNLIGINLGGGGSVDDSLPVIRAGFNTLSLAANDDNSTGLTPLGFTANFFGQIFTDTFVNNNGNITFNAPLFNFTPFNLLSNAVPIIAPYFGDVDTRGAGSIVTYGQGTVAGRQAFGVNWVDVDYFSATSPGHVSLLNDFQLVLVDRSDISAGDFDIEFNYGTINWETGDASGGTNGLGGNSARAGYSNGVDTAFELAGSAVPGSFLDSGPAATSLVQNSLNSSVLGRYVFSSRGGVIGAAGGNGGDGIRIEATNGSNLQNVNIDNNQIGNNNGSGVNIVLTGGSEFNSTSTGSISGNEIFNHAGGDGIRIVNPDTNNTNINLTIADNNIHENAGGSGINMTLDANVGVVTAAVTNNTLSDNGGSGLLADLSGDASLQVTNFDNNVVNGNAQMGVRVNTADTSTFLLDGSVGGNTLDANAAAGIGAVVSDDSTADIRLANSTVTNSTAGALANFNGEGIRVLVQDNGELAGTSLIDQNTITGNNGNGVDLLVLDSGSIGGMTINDNTINGNGTTGVRIERQDSGTIGLVGDRLEISGNTITDENEAVLLIAANTNSIDFYEMNDNVITGMTGAGVHFEVRADADMDVNMDNNLITNSGTDGILVSEQINDPSDSRSITGIWTNNVITDNGRHGINLSGLTAGLVIGDTVVGTFPPPLANGNLISGNENDGISITGAGSVTIAGNLITDNGSNGTDDAGIDFSGATFNDVTIVNNAIVNNRGDGIEYEGDGQFGGSFAVINGNNISFNDGRGLDLLVQPSGTGFSSVDMTFNDNVVTNNQLEGVYVIFTASRTQTQDVASTVALNSDGNVTDDVFLRFNSDNNIIQANGNSSGFSSTGMVVRIGTTDGSTSIVDDGGFASDGLGNFTRSGVIMSVTDTTFGGNFGDDVYFDSFTSTVAPPTSAGTWGTTDDPTAVTTYRTDPLARLDLTFTGNTFNSTDVNNTGAFYNNAEGTFKSRLNNASAPNIGPFTDADRRRNAQRQASRYATNFPAQLNPNTDGVPDNYLYPGMGNSTFRVSAGSQPIFNLDNPTLVGSPTEVDATFEANGVNFGGTVFGELPFGWGTF